MEIQIADQRPPLTVTISLAKKQGDHRLPAWQAEMTQMVVEVTRKFHGSITSENVARGLQTTIGILSLGLMHATKGERSADAWLLHLQQHGIKKTSAQIVEKVKEIVDLPTSEYLDPSAGMTPTAREQLLYFAREGYERMCADEAKRRRNRLQIDLAHWLLANTSVGPAARRYLSGDFKEIATVDDVFFYILPRIAQIPSKYLPSQETFGDISLEIEEDFDSFEGGKIKLPAAAWKTAKKNYSDFTATLPEALRPALDYDGTDWFDAHIQRASAATLREKKKQPLEKISLEELEALENFDITLGNPPAPSTPADSADGMRKLLKALMGESPLEEEENPTTKKPAKAKGTKTATKSKAPAPKTAATTKKATRPASKAKAKKASE